ncbi:plasma alpha-L-fucosidase-like [Mytilus edulis]|uniref:plasma alpha-L-fucosidase-like n=1 Tax=Mytilus edulis TaxID=6550 RepID=UPI0039EE444A
MFTIKEVNIIPWILLLLCIYTVALQNPNQNIVEEFNFIKQRNKGDKLYPPNWEDLDKRPLPVWYDSAKIGIFVVWGVYSVPSVYDEWFWYFWKGQKIPKYVEFMKKNYRPGFTYPDFASMLTAEFLDTDEWATLFKSSGAEYVVFTTKHHEGFTMWPSNYSFNWNSMAVGPKRDIVGELVTSLRKKDLRVGLYHSLFEWFNPMFLLDKANNFKTQEFVRTKTMPELYELVNNYKPDLIWSDGSARQHSSYWNSTEFLAWLYNYSPVRDEVVTNDRWGIDTVCKHGGFLTCSDRFNPGKLQKKKWENAMTIDKQSWGFRRNAKIDEFLTIEELIATVVKTVSCGGNILINVAPSYDGTIQPVFQERLKQMGSWLQVNSDAIYSSFPWKYQNDTFTPRVWYTEQQIKTTNAVYAMTLDWPEKYLYLQSPIPVKDKTFVYLLGTEGQLGWTASPQGGINITIPYIPYSKMPCRWAWVFRLEGLQNG